MDNQTREARQMAKNLPLKDKIAHIWTYYKWWIIGVTVGVVLIAGTAYEIATRPTYDLEIGYYSDKYVSDETIAAMEAYFAQFVEDMDQDGQQTVKIYAVSASMMGGSGEGQMAIQSKFMAELSSGAYPVFFFDDTFFEMMKQDAYDGTMEFYRDMADIPELKEKFQIQDGSHVYWATRELYQNEAKKEEKIAVHEHAVRTEQAIFGERPAHTSAEDPENREQDLKQSNFPEERNAGNNS